MLKYSELQELSQKTGVPCEEFTIETAQTMAPPYCVYFYETKDHFSADGVVYIQTLNVQLEVVTAALEDETVDKVEEFFEEKDVYYTVEIEHSAEARLYVHIYNFFAVNG